MVVTLVTLVFSLAANAFVLGGCSATAEHATADSTGPGTAVSDLATNAGTIPRFIAGTYDLVLVDDEPLFDDSMAVRAHVDSRLPWSVVDAARDWRDSARVLDAFFKGLQGTPDEALELAEARSAADSASVTRRLLDDLRCTEWRSAGTLQLEADGRIVTEDEMRTYCRGKMPAFTRRFDRGEPSELETCRVTEAAVPGIARHVTCREGRWWKGSYPYRYAGDTLSLGTDCDGTDTYILRATHGYAPTPARSSDIAKIEGC